MDRFALVILELAAAVGVTVGLAVRLIQSIVERIRNRRFSRSVGWPATLGWTAGFAIAAFAVASALSIGPFVLPFAVVLCGVAAWRCRALPEGAIGASLGVGVVLCVLGLMHLMEQRLPSACGVTITLRAGERASFRGCDGFNGASWILLGVALVVAAVAVQILMGRRQTQRAHTLGATPAM